MNSQVPVNKIRVVWYSQIVLFWSLFMGAYAKEWHCCLFFVSTCANNREMVLVLSLCNSFDLHWWKRKSVCLSVCIQNQLGVLYRVWEPLMALWLTCAIFIYPRMITLFHKRFPLTTIIFLELNYFKALLNFIKEQLTKEQRNVVKSEDLRLVQGHKLLFKSSYMKLLTLKVFT